MSKKKRPYFVRCYENKIVFRSKVNPTGHRDFMSALNHCLKKEPSKMILDFKNVTHAYPNGMVPIISTIDRLRDDGIEVFLKLPAAKDVRRLFLGTNWAHLLCPEKFREENAVHDRHLIARRFSTPEQQQSVVNDFLDVVMRNMRVARDVISGLEWSINEITDNVLNHANSPDGGIVQVSTYIQNNSVAFAVADSGIGILNSLRQGIPTLGTDIQAIGEAVKAGVTRHPLAGQGNGLAGTLRIASMSGGSFAMTSGRGSMMVYEAETNRSSRHVNQNYIGTLVCADIKTNGKFSIAEALGFTGTVNETPVDLIEVNYENQNGSCLKFKLSDETTGFGNRISGKQLRTKCMNILTADQSKPLQIDWAGVPITSSSFADEFIGKLFLELGPITFSARVQNVGMEALIKALLDKAISQRLTQANDELLH